MGRPTDCTPERTAIIVEALRKGCYMTEAAAVAGVTLTTLNLWCRKGREGHGEPYASFALAVKDAKSYAVTSLLSIIREHAKENWQAGAWILERRHYKQWGRKSQVEAKVTAVQNGPNLDSLSHEEKEKLFAALATRHHELASKK